MWLILRKEPFQWCFLLSNTLVFLQVGAFGRWGLALRSLILLSQCRAQVFFSLFETGFLLYGVLVVLELTEISLLATKFLSNGTNLTI